MGATARVFDFQNEKIHAAWCDGEHHTECCEENGRAIAISERILGRKLTAMEEAMIRASDVAYIVK